MLDRNKMKYKGFEAQIMEAERLEGTHTFGLPPGSALDVYYVDEFLNPPENWMKGQGVFVVPVKPDKGLWFNWRDNDELNTAVIPTVRGCNPITGLKTSGFHLEQYENKCPKHGCDFMADRFCPKCDYKWPDRNYCSQDPLWWDGFRSGDSIRQFFFTADSMRDVATALIGKENTIPAFGFAFYTPKEKRERIKSTFSSDDSPPIACAGTMDFNNSSSGDAVLDSFSLEQHELPKSTPTGGLYFLNKSTKKAFLSQSFSKSVSENDSQSGGITIGSKGLARGITVPKQVPMKKKVVEVSIGAGAKIRQSLNKDSYPLESWKGAPSAVMTIYFIFQEKFDELKAGGMRDLEGKPEGMLDGIPVG